MSVTPGTIYRELWQDPAAMVSWHSVEGIYRAASPGSNAVVGWPDGEIVGRNPFELLHADDLPAIMAYRQRLWSGAFRHEHAIFRIKGKDGEFRWVKSQTKRGHHREWGPVSVSVSRAWTGNPKAAVITDDGDVLDEADWTGESG